MFNYSGQQILIFVFLTFPPSWIILVPFTDFGPLIPNLATRIRQHLEFSKQPNKTCVKNSLLFGLTRTLHS
jgi:hypothetical protein